MQLYSALKNSKFVIDGAIEGKAESKYLKKTRSRNFKRLQGIVWTLVVIGSVFVILSFILYLETQHLKQELRSVKDTILKAESVIEKNNAFAYRIDTLQKQVIKLVAEKEQLLEISKINDGIYFEVQVGNYQNYDLDRFEDELTGMHQEKSKNGTRLTLGRFRSFEKALLFENEMKQLGLKQAFVVGRVNGKLTDYHEALRIIQNRAENKPEP